MHEPSLSLRCTDRLIPSVGPQLAPFLAGARTAQPGVDDPLTWLAPTQPLPGTGGLRQRPLAAPIPLSAPELDLGAFALGLRAQLPSPSPRWVAMAAAVPLALSPALASAEEAMDESAEVDEGDAGDEGGQPGEGDPASESAPAPAMGPVEPAAPDDLSYDGLRLWEAVRGTRVHLTLQDSLRVKGVVLAQADGEIAIAREPDGTVMRIPKELVIGMRVIPAPVVLADGTVAKPEKPPRGGKAPAVVGGILTGLGATMVTTFAIGAAVDSSFPYYGFPLMLVGPALLAPGIPLFVAGLAQEERRHEWMVDQVELSGGPTRDGWSGRLSIRF